MKSDCLSLFSGAMGLDLGLREAGIETIACAESNPACIETILLNRPGMQIFKDVHDITAKSFPYSPFLIAGGSPCQSFSMAGKRASFSDPRGLLAFEFGRIVNELRPRFFLMENVKGILSAPGMQPGKTALQEILASFTSLGYKTVYGTLLAADFGVPQLRERVIVIGSRDGEDIFLPSPTHFKGHQDPKIRWRTLKDAIPERPLVLDTLGECSSFPESVLRFLRLVPPGGNWRSLPKDMQKEAMGGALEGGRTGFFRRLSWDRPCPTLTTCPTQKATTLCHPDENRPLSVNEYAAIQQFPPEWKFSGSTADKYRQIGNAVPIGLGKAIGRAIVVSTHASVQIKTQSEGDIGIAWK